MLLIKRVLATFIDFVFFYLVVWLLHLFIFLTSEDTKSLGLIEDILKAYTYIELSELIVLRVFFCFIVTNFIMLICTRGSQTLLDYWVDISFKSPQNKLYKFNSLVSCYIFTFLMVLCQIVQYEIQQVFSFDKMTDKLAQSAQSGYFPKDVFGKYISGSVIQEVVQTNYIIPTFSAEALIFNTFLYQDRITVQINDSVRYNSNIRLDLCKKLIEYSQKYRYNQVDDSSIIQTRIQLVHYKFTSPNTFVESHYFYYYDNAYPINGINGNYDPDTLLEFYHKTERNFNLFCLHVLRDSLHLNDNTVKSCFLNDSTLQITDTTILNKMQRYLSNVNVIASVLDSSIYTMTVTPFEKVYPIGYYQFQLTATKYHPTTTPQEDLLLGKALSVKTQYVFGNR